MIMRLLYPLKRLKIFLSLFVIVITVSCSTVSPFRKNNGEYTSLPSVFGKNEELTILVNKKLLRATGNENDVLKRAEFLSITKDNDGNVIGALEGEYLTDVIRYATGKNQTFLNGYNVIQPDSGVFLFANGNINNAYERVIKNRQDIISEEELKDRFKNAINIFGKNVKNIFGIRDKVDDIAFNKIDIKLNMDTEDDNNLTMNGEILIDNKDDSVKFYTYFKTWYVGQLRTNHIQFEIEELDKAIIKHESTIKFNNLIVPKSLIVSLFTLT